MPLLGLRPYCPPHVPLPLLARTLLPNSGSKSAARMSGWAPRPQGGAPLSPPTRRSGHEEGPRLVYRGHEERTQGTLPPRHTFCVCVCARVCAPPSPFPLFSAVSLRLCLSVSLPPPPHLSPFPLPSIVRPPHAHAGDRDARPLLCQMRRAGKAVGFIDETNISGLPFRGNEAWQQNIPVHHLIKTS